MAQQTQFKKLKEQIEMFTEYKNADNLNSEDEFENNPKQ